MKRETLLVTGATGAVGHEVVRTLLSGPEPPRLFLLMRGGPARISSRLAGLLAWAEVDPGRPPDVRVLRGEASESGLGMSQEDRLRVEEEVTGILHMAATTDFHQTRQGAAFNVASTRRVLEVAGGCRRLDRIGLVSTAFVAGRRTGVIRESDLAFGDGFCNAYERSKALAEEEGRAAMGSLPIAIYRLSIVVGRRKDGRLPGPTLFSSACRLFYRGLLPIVPGDTAQPVDMIPADFAAQSLTALLRQGFVRGATYHVCAGRRSLSLDGIFAAIAEEIGRADPGWGRLGIARPVVATATEFQELLEDLERAGSPGLRKIVRPLRGLTRQLETPKSFDTAVFDRAIGRLGLELSKAGEWIQPLVGRALAGNGIDRPMDRLAGIGYAASGL